MSRRGAPPGVRRPAVAGTFYPAEPHELRELVDRQLARARSAAEANDRSPDAPPAARPKAIIVPHAGFIYSGPIAASAYVRLTADDPPIERVVLLGPAHRVPLFGVAVPTVRSFATPLGLVDIDDSARQLITSVPVVTLDDRAHADEHSLEVHLPFLQRTLGDGWSLLPLVVGDVRPGDVADVLDRCWGGPETLIVASSDLSHYHDQPTAQALDRSTAELIVERRFTDLHPDRACGARAVAGLLEAALRHDLDVDLLDLRTSGDTAGPRDRVVGYGAFAVS